MQYEGIPVPRLGEVVTAHLQPQPPSEGRNASTPPVHLVRQCIREASLLGESLHLVYSHLRSCCAVLLRRGEHQSPWLAISCLLDSYI